MFFDNPHIPTTPFGKLIVGDLIEKKNYFCGFNRKQIVEYQFEKSPRSLRSHTGSCELNRFVVHNKCKKKNKQKTVNFSAHLRTELLKFNVENSDKKKKKKKINRTFAIRWLWYTKLGPAVYSVVDRAFVFF